MAFPLVLPGFHHFTSLSLSAKSSPQRMIVNYDPDEMGMIK